jgi:cyclophilin family peptidyl-prolyl cis-trans isomerase
MRIAFNGTTYTLEYKLYRKLAPNTVNHFLALVENGYYNEKDGQNICIHDYTDTKWYTGGYSYNANSEENGGLSYRDYFSIVSAYSNQDFLSVWKDTAKTMPTYTLYGEFPNNGMEMAKGDFLAPSFGSLAMYYEDKGDKADTFDVYVERVDGNGIRKTKYEMNSATSMFSINLSGTTDRAHCTFATLQDSSVEELKALQSAVNKFIETNFPDSDEDGESFTNEVEMSYGEGDPFIANAGLTVEYDVPTTPIIIKSIKVLKY